MSQKKIHRHARELEHHEAAGEDIKKKRWERSDSGTAKPKGTAGRKKRSRNSDDKGERDEDEEQDEEGGGGEGSGERMPPRKRSRSSKENVAFRSRSVIDEEEGS